MFFKYLFFSSFLFFMGRQKTQNPFVFSLKNKRIAEYLLMLN